MRSITPVVALLGTALVLTACAGPSTTKGSHEPGDLADGQTFTLASGDPGNLDPLTTNMTGARSMGRFLYGTLIDTDSKGQVVAGLAESWELAPDAATFTLHEGLTCEDGTPLTASDIAKEITYIGNPANGSSLAATNVAPGTTAVGDDVARTVTVTSAAPNPFLLETVGTTPIVCGNVLDDADARAKGKGATGLFSLDEIVPNSRFTLIRRTDTDWGPGDWDPRAKGLPDKVVFRVIPNPATAANMLITGEVNAASVSGPDKSRVQNEGFFTSSTEGLIGQLQFNQAKDRPTADPEVRRALVEALDLALLRDVITNGEGTEPSSIVTMMPNPCRSDAAKGAFPTYDPKAAAATLDAAGWTTGSDGAREKDGVPLSITLASPTALSDAGNAASEMIYRAWTELGVKTEVRAVENNALQELLFISRDWDVSAIPFTFSLPTQLSSYYAGPVPRTARTSPRRWMPTTRRRSRRR